MENVANVLQTFHFDDMPHYIVIVVTKLRNLLTVARGKLNPYGMRTVFNADWYARGQAVCTLVRMRAQIQICEVVHE
jgi:hypothetical protein